MRHAFGYESVIPGEDQQHGIVAAGLARMPDHAELQRQVLVLPSDPGGLALPSMAARMLAAICGRARNAMAAAMLTENGRT